MSEEIHNPEKNIPRAIVFGILVNGLIGFAMLLACLFCFGDPDYVLGSPTGYPFLAIFQQAVGSVSGTLAMGSIVTIMNINATMSFVATASRDDDCYLCQRRPRYCDGKLTQALSRLRLLFEDHRASHLGKAACLGGRVTASWFTNVRVSFR